MKPLPFNPSRYKTIYAFLAIALTYVLAAFLTNTFVLTDDLYIKEWSQHLSPGRIQKMLNANRKFEWAEYILTPVVLLIKLLLITFAIQAGLFVFEIKTTFKNIFRIVLLAEIIPLLNVVVQCVYFFFKHIHSFDQINLFAPLSLLSMINVKSMPSYLIYPLQVVSLFEVAYWIALAAGLKMYLGKSLTKNLRLVASTYGLTLLLWMVLVVFIQIQMD